ncbi:glycosyltransferase [Shimia sp.]|uniref:glycosyltransferase n=1 Tax=Shimia sp. TaxID=1954381 RepID=UPI003BA92CAB
MKNGLAVFAWDDGGGVNKIHHTIMAKTSVNWRHLYLNEKNILNAFAKLYRKLSGGDFDVVFVGNGREALLAELAKRISFKKFRIVYVQHTPIEFSGRKSGLSAAFFRFLVKRQSVITISNELHESLSTALSIPSDAIELIYNPVLEAEDADFLLPSHQNEPIRLLGVGRLSTQKNFVFMIGLVRFLLDQGISCELSIFGEGEDEHLLKEEIARLDLEDFVHLKGFSTEIHTEFASHDVFLLCSLWEGLPTVLIEALQYCPRVVAYQCPTGVAEILHEQPATCVVSRLDHASFKAAIEQVLSLHGPIQRKFKKYSVQRNISKYQAIFDV